VKEGQVVTGGLLVAGRNPAIMLDSAEKPLDFVTVFVEILVNLTLDGVGLSRWNHGLGLSGFDPSYKVGAVEPLVGNDRLKGVVVGKRFSLDDVSPVAGTQNQLQRVAQCIDRRIDLRGETSPRPTERFDRSVTFFDRQRAGGL